MGSWGTGLYQDDEADDLKDTIKLLSKMPANGEKIIDILLDMSEHGGDIKSEGGPLFWLVVADQFAKKGIVSELAVSKARDIIDSEIDLNDLKARGLDETGIKSRKKVYEKILLNIENPKSPDKRKVAKNPPRMIADIGDVYAFPAMNGTGFNAYYSDWEEASFIPDGWGALLIVDGGRAFDWFPWLAYTSLSVNPYIKPTFEAVMVAETIHPQGVAYCAPKLLHFKKMQFEKIGRLELLENTVKLMMSRSYRDGKSAAIIDRSICSDAVNEHADITSYPVHKRIKILDLMDTVLFEA